MSPFDRVKDIRLNLEEILQPHLVSLPNLSDVEFLCTAFKRELEIESSLIEDLKGKYIVVGDLHGSFQDLNFIIRKYGNPSNKLKYLFLGDYIDRGHTSIETILYLMCLKVLYPDFVTLLRGNHEFIGINKFYGFYDECINRLGNTEGSAIFEAINETFPYLPLAAILPNGIFAVHGGISSHINTLDDIRKIDRFQIVDCSSSIVVTDLVWGDPRKLESGQLTAPSERGLGEKYSLSKTQQFLTKNNLTSIIRAHEACQEGFMASLVDDNGKTVCLTVFSATNYCEQNNIAAVAIINKKGLISIEKFDCTSSDDEIETDRGNESLEDLYDALC
ncbi:Ser/Thr protein phosphatase, putative [Trichomonas vaginalis G3]|uniref:Serine/threonine-protein phosphatase n=1 Tax=Trichomonas vaginalis (strain ATCC PRA-98 / G3) TaxID=412133 RepID=A2DWY5_TRIV3|nr:phosphoprotein phosphatase protein [Trichomonas vaginalis G3]EAY15012.1 Ser/Thr protein phosphatase, putative [Trichomonas vaginalis G3]KAI5549553.1 phosphoprotein phosphatase protein [Trichomonas vaginalis G3]|eukprot:XP_001327235.1 Ser/Thr protein phosphatase [Trichomonas vaginalis G3]